MPKVKSSSSSKSSETKGKSKKATTGTFDETNEPANTASNIAPLVDADEASKDKNDSANQPTELQAGGDLDGQSKQEKKNSLVPDEKTAALENKYQEPVLSYIIIEQYEGGKEKGLFDGFGKATYTGGHVYEGEFHEGMMNGKGKYVWSNGITYEGDFLNNEITGNGIYTWPNQKNQLYSASSLSLSLSQSAFKSATYEGDVFKSKRHGFGTFKSGCSPLKYTGYWRMGKIYGKGKMIYDKEGISYYEGDWIKNKKFGYGIRRYSSGNIYEGMWVNDIRHGEGTMRWFDKNQIYTGQWENGVQNGMGEHNWYLVRVDETQYALRNTYYGMFVDGKRHGQGTFLYANGAKYEGFWDNDCKHGWGKFTFKNGEVYEGYFEEDKMTESPTYMRKSKLSEEIAKIKTRMPSAGTTLDLNKLRQNHQDNRTDFDLKLDLNNILYQIDDQYKRNLESEQAHKTIIRYLDLFKHLYRFYSQLGFETSPDNTYVLNRMQFWRFLIDCQIHLNKKGITLMEFDRLLANKSSGATLNWNDLHCPYDKILIREFFDYIVILAYHLYADELSTSGLLISSCIEKLIADNIFPNSFNVKGNFYSDSRKTLNVLTYMVQAYDIYKLISKKRKKEPFDSTLTMRDLLQALNKFKLIDGVTLKSKDVIESLAVDNFYVFDEDNSYNLDFEITFLEFFEALIGCANKLFLNIEAAKSAATKPKSAKPSRSSSSIQQPMPTHPTPELQESSPVASLGAKQPTQSEIADNKVVSSRGKLDSATGSSQEETTSTKELQSIEAETSSAANLATNNKGNSNENVETIAQEENRVEFDMQAWIEKNNFFFINKLFPAAQSYEALSQKVNYLA